MLRWQYLSLLEYVLSTFVLFKDAEAAESQAPKTAAGENAVCSPLDGKLIDITEVRDEVFSAGILGDGMAVIPEKGELYAPVDATVDTVFDSKHAISLIGDNGAEILLHVGLDTVKLEGMHFEPQVKNGDRVKAGQLLMKFDIKEIKKAGYDIVTPIIITNSDKYKLSKATGGLVSVGNPVIGLEKKEDDR